MEAGVIPRRLIEEILAKCDIVSIIGRRVKLHKAGKEWCGKSPWTNERTGSFFVSEQKKRFFDFSAGRHGTLIDFVMLTEGLSFLEAVASLAREAGVKLERRRFTKEEIAKRSLEEEMRDVLNETQRCFTTWLRNPVGRVAERLCRERGLSGDIIGRMGIGYAPRHHELARSLSECGFSGSACAAAGVFRDGDIRRLGGTEEAFLRDRLTFPIRDAKGRIVAHGGRVLGLGSGPKYLNGRETSLFQKSQTLFNLSDAAEEIRKSGAIIMEGYIDVATATQAGFGNAVATLGTSLSVDQLSALWRLHPTHVLCFDADAAGIRATQRVLACALPYMAGERRLAFASLIAGQDPDSLIRDQGPEALEKALSQARTADQVLWEGIRAEVKGDGPDARAEAEKRAVEACEIIADEALRKAYRSELRDKARRIGRKTYASRTQVVDLSIPVREAAIALAAAKHAAEYVEPDIERLAQISFTAPIAQRVMQLAIQGEVDFRDLKVLEGRMPRPAPSFVSELHADAFRAAVDLQMAAQAKRKLRSP